MIRCDAREKEEINPNVSADRFSLPLHFFMPCRMQAITLKKRLKLKKDNRDEQREEEEKIKMLSK